MKKILVEVCCGSADDVIEAKKAGADRVELNSDLFHGGLTPTVGSLLVAKRETGMKIMTMIRPREGGFCYTEAEFAVAIEDAKQLLANGSDGLVFGFLHTDGTIDVKRTAILANLAYSAGKEAVFHRAIDVVPDWKQALDLLIDLNITRVLTSGQEADDQIHLAAHRSVADTSVLNNRSIFYGGCLYPPEDRYNMIDKEYISGIVTGLEK